MQSQPLTSETLARGVAFLGEVDPDLRRIHTMLGLPPLWARQPGFGTLVYIILEQQVSLASARAAFLKLEAALGVVTPGEFLTLSDERLKQIGFSRQKTAYCRHLAQAVLNNDLDLRELEHLEDHSVRSELIRIKGIGAWTADIYLLMALLRPDIWPAGDLALATAMQEVKSLPARPGPQEMEQIASAWHPWRAVAARLLWHHYLSK